MSGIGFLVFCAAFIFLCFMHFAAAIWALQKLRNDGSDEIDMDFVRVENFQARETRAGRRSAEGCFSGDAVLGAGSMTRAVAADGSLTLLDGARVTGFADSQGEMKIGKDCCIEGRVTSARAIRLGRGASVRACAAPEITTERAESSMIDTGEGTASGSLRAVTSIPGEEFQGRIERLSADTWICKGDLTAAGPVNVSERLVVRGSFSAGAGSELNADLKAMGDLTIGAGSICRGRLVSGGTMTIEQGCRFECMLYAGEDLHLGERVVGEALHPVVAYAAGRVWLSRGILVRGKLAAGREVVTLP